MSFEELMKDAEFAKAVEAAEDVKTLVELLKSKGVEITEEEMEKALDVAEKQGDELDENALENVAGGMSISLMIALGLAYWAYCCGKRILMRRR